MHLTQTPLRSEMICRDRVKVLNVVNLCSGWWRKLTDLVRDTHLDGLFTRKVKIVVVKVGPSPLQERYMLGENGFRPFVVNGQTLCDAFQLNGRCRLSSTLGAGYGVRLGR